MKSRVFTRWSNRASEEEDKARVALRAHEMGLKSKAFGVRPRLEVLALALQQRILSNDGSDSPIELPERPASAPVESTASPLGSPLPLPAQLAKSDEDLPRAVDVVQDEPEEEDERTMLARRHIMRMRFFRAWAEYTQTHTEKVKGYVMHATLDSWRGTSGALDIRVSSHAHQHEQDNARITLQKWIAAASESAGLNAQAEEMEKRARVEGVLKPWLAQARAGRRLEAKKEGDFWQWYNTPFRDLAFDRAAILYYEDRKKREAISKWRLVAEEARRRGDMRQDWASKADYYRAATTTLRTWKAQAREHAVQVSMKGDAFDAWRQLSAGDLPQQQQMQSFAERADFFYKMTEILPAWQAVADENSNKEQQLEEYSERANFYYRARDTVLVWRTLAKKRRKARFKEAHLEVRRRVKRGMGEYCIAQWRDKLQTSFDRYEYMNVALEDAVAGREYVATAETFDTWRRRAQEKTQLGLMSNDTIKQRAIDTWRERHLTIQDMQFEAGQYRKNRSTGKALRWITSERRVAADYFDNALKHGTGVLRLSLCRISPTRATRILWRMRSSRPRVSSQRVSYSHHGELQRQESHRLDSKICGEEDVADVAEDELSLEPAPEPEVEAGTPYAPTPGRPQLLLGSFGRQQTTTPLAPVPSRQAAWPARDSVLGGSAIELRANRAGGRSRRNLRVSWAQ
ncbi:Sfi1 spindle body protein-domain-containing protein [Apiospora marii]|uniref:Sfi1 spindle body protein-domain-containing protein n=1 Tax=Apiospora marii TaxID=335849 RepID=A0ABR1RAU9_9PEZI